MKKIIHTCFLAKLCPFPNRSRTITPLFEPYFCDEGAVFPQPQADIFHRRSRSISQTEGLHQKCFLQAFFILLILFGSIINVNSQVAFSPKKELSSPSFHPRQKEYSPSAFGEKSMKSDSLEVGDYLPEDLVVNTLSDSGTKPLMLRDLQGKYLVLQFWATWCTASSSSLPKAEALQEKFGEEIQFVPVSYEPEANIRKSLSLYSSLSDLEMPMAVNESRLNKLFPHVSLPHLVIADPEGKILAITGWEDMTEAHLELLLSTGVSAFRLKKDESIPFSLKENLISGNQQIPSKNIRFQSALTNYLPGVPATLMDDIEDGAHILAVNIPLYKLYRLAFTGRDFANFFGSNRIVLEGFGEEDLNSRKSGLDYIAWMEEGGHVFGYELIAPPGLDQYQLMREDLARFFPEIDAKVEIRKRKVWALKLEDGRTYPPSDSQEKLYQFSPVEAKLQKSLLLGLIYQLNLYSLQRSEYPLIDLTGINYPIDIELKGNFSKPEELKAAFQKAGLQMELEEMEIPVLVLRKIALDQSTQSIQP